MKLRKLHVGRERHRRPKKRRFQPSLESLEQRCVPTVDMVSYWNQVALDATVVDNGLDAPRLQIGPTRASRVLAIESLAVFDAVNSITQTYTPYLTSVPAPRSASIDAAAAVAGYETLTAMYPYQQSTFAVDLVQSLAGIPLIPAIEGAVVGHIVAQRMLAARANDGSDDNTPWVYGQLPGQWRADPIRVPTLDPLGQNWGRVQPFALQSGDQFMAPPPPAITSLDYAEAYEVTKAYGALFSTYRTQDQVAIGIFWGYDAQPDVCAPVRLYNQISGVLSTQEGLTEVQNARIFALVNMAMADAAISSWNDKYSYNYWRPVTAIRENDPGTGPSGLGSGNQYLYNPDQGIDEGDPNWGPFGAPANDGYGNFTPPFPSYTSGHAVIGGAMFAMLTDYFQSNDIPFTCTTDEANTQPVDQYGNPVELDPRPFDHFSDAADENAQSRIYLGIHFDFDKEQGVAEGYRIADYVFNNELQPLRGPRQTGIAVDVLNNVLLPQMASEFADELATIGFNPAPRPSAGLPSGGAVFVAGVDAGQPWLPPAFSPSSGSMGWDGGNASVSTHGAGQLDPRTLGTSGSHAPSTDLVTQGDPSLLAGADGQDLNAVNALGDLASPRL